LPTKYPIGLFERSVNWFLKIVGMSILGLWVGLWFAPGLVATFVFANYMSIEAAASFGSLVWGAWLVYWAKAKKLPQVRVIGADLDHTVKLCFRAHDPRFFEDQSKNSE